MKDEWTARELKVDDRLSHAWLVHRATDVYQTLRGVDLMASNAKVTTAWEHGRRG